MELNVMQRCSSHICSKTDIDEAERIGRHALRAALDGETGKMMCFRRVKGEGGYRVEIFAENAANVANIVKSVPASFIPPDGCGITDKCIDYMLPLIKGENPIVYEDGLPVHFEF